MGQQTQAKVLSTYLPKTCSLDLQALVREMKPQEHLTLFSSTTLGIYPEAPVTFPPVELAKQYKHKDYLNPLEGIRRLKQACIVGTPLSRQCWSSENRMLSCMQKG